MSDPKLPPTDPPDDQPRYANDTALNPPPESSWGKVLRHVPEGTRVLDIGCARGSFSAAMTRLKGCTVVGVEFEEEAAAVARTRCETVLVGDIATLLASPDFPKDFDVIVAADVLEHLLDPAGVLKALCGKLRRGGILLASIPNSTHFSIIASLAAGRFPRSREGLLDSTHIQFFGEGDIRELFERTGYAQRIVDRVRMDPRFTEFKTEYSGIPDPVVAFFDGHPNSDTYQFIIRAVPTEWATESDREPAVAATPPAPVRNRLASELAGFEKKIGEYHDAMQAAGKRNDALLATIEEYRQALQRSGPTALNSSSVPLISRGEMPQLADSERRALRVLFIAERDDASYRYRCLNACEELRRSGVIANAAFADDESISGEIKSYSVVILFRVRWSEQIARIVDAARANGISVAFGVDDLIFHPSMESLLPFLEHLPRQGVNEYRELFAGLNKTFNAADFVYSSTPVISRYAQLHGKPIVEHPNLLPTSFQQLSRIIYPLREVLMRAPFIGYMSGSKTHDGDLASVAEPLASVLASDTNLKLLLAGPLALPPALAEFSDRVVHFDYLDHRVYPWLMARCRAVIAPIEVINDFSNAKSSLKIFEAGIFGVPAVATPTEQYSAAIEDGVTGFLARDAQDWQKALSELTHFRRSRTFGRRARELAMRRHGAEAYANALAHSLLHWATKARPGRAPVARPLDTRLQDIRDVRAAARLARTSLKVALRSSASSGHAGNAIRQPEVLSLPNAVASVIASAKRTGPRLSWGATALGDLLADRERPLGLANSSNNVHPIPVTSTPGAAFACTGFDPGFVLSHPPEVGAQTDLLVITMKATAEGGRFAQFFWGGASEPFSEENSIRFRIKTDGLWHTYLVDLRSRLTHWPENGVARTRFDPMDDVGEFELGTLALVSRKAVEACGQLNLRSSIPDRFLGGEGIEIGALHNPLPVPPSAHVRYVDRLTLQALKEEYPELAGFNLVSPSIIAEAETLEGVPTSSQQFVIANHVLEHMRDPLGSLEHWLRVLRPGGVLYLSIPDHLNTHDARRKITEFRHLLDDRSSDREARAIRDLEHYSDWTRSAHTEMNAQQQDAFTAELIRTEHRIHFHVFDLALFERVLSHTLPSVGATLVELAVNGTKPDLEYVAVIRKSPVAKAARVGVDIVVPIFNARELTRRCVESVLQHGTGDFRVILVNDRSTDPGISGDLAAFAARDPRVVVIEQETNQGFVGTANRGMRAAGDRDVLLLNSDTEVFAGFLDRLIDAAYAKPDTGILTPFSNNATLCSVPEMGRDNPIPDGYSAETFAALVSAVSKKRRPEIVTGVGFCMYVKREVIEKIGDFDGETFGRGFGEENDFVERAKKAGYTNRLCDDVFVWHKGKASFAAEGHALETTNAKLLENKHPGYHAAVAHFFTTNPLKELHDELRFHLARMRHGAFNAPLYLIHSSPFAPDAGGTEFHLRDLIRSLKLPRAVVAWPQKGNIRIAEVLDGDVDQPLNYSIPLDVPVLRYAVEHAQAEEVLRKIVRLFGIRFVHVHHLFHWPLSAVEVLRSEQLPVVYTSHDFYAVCPSWNLFDVRTNTCCGCDVQIDGPGCVAPLTLGPENQVLPLRLAHRAAFQKLLGEAAGVIFPSESARRTVAKFVTLSNNSVVIPHGLDVPAAAAEVARAPPGERLRIGVVGSVNIRIKGSDEYLQLATLLRDAAVEWRMFGPAADSDFAAQFVERAGAAPTRLLGPYKRDEIVRHLAAEGLDVIVLLPAVDESFSFVLSEAWAAGVPVVGVSKGSLVERIAASGAGVTVGTVEEAATTLSGFAADRSALVPLAEKARAVKLLTNAESTERLRAFYDRRGLLQLLREARPLQNEVLHQVWDLRPVTAAPVEAPASPPTYQKNSWYPYFQRVKPLVPPALRELGRSMLERRDAVVRLNPASRNGHIRAMEDLRLVRRKLQSARFEALGLDPRIEFVIPPVSASDVSSIRFRMRHNLGNHLFAQIFWAHQLDEGFTERKSATVAVGNRDGNLHEYVVKLDAAETQLLWREGPTVMRIRFDPVNVKGEFEVSPVDLIGR